MGVKMTALYHLHDHAKILGSHWKKLEEFIIDIRLNNKEYPRDCLLKYDDFIKFYMDIEYIKEFLIDIQFSSTGKIFNGCSSVVRNVDIDSVLHYNAIISHIICTWRYSQGIYKFDNDIFNYIINTKLERKIPAQSLLRLPEWSIYIETPGLEIDGFFASLQYNCNKINLCILLNYKDHDSFFLAPIILKIKSDTVYNCLLDFFNSDIYDLIYIDYPKKNLESLVRKIVSLLLYICCDSPDITDDKNIKSTASYPSLKKNKNEFRLLPPRKAKIWTVGQETGNTLRFEKKSYINNSGGKEPHVRRAHWHGYWRGKKNEQEFFYQWLPPILISGNKMIRNKDEVYNSK